MIIWNGPDLIGYVIGGVILVANILFFVGYGIYDKIKKMKDKKMKDKKKEDK